MAWLRHRSGRRLRRVLIAEAAHEEYSADVALWEDELAVDRA